MTNLILQVDTNTFQKGRHNITGHIWFSVGSGSFPADGWDDFPIVILGWWLEALRSRHLQRNTCDLIFMDGPFSLKITTLDPANILVEPHKNSTAIRGLAVSVPVANLDTQVLKAAEIVDKACRENDWDSRDVAFLQKQIIGFRQLAQR